MRYAKYPHKVTLIPISEEVYTEITRETTRIRNKRQYHGQFTRILIEFVWHLKFPFIII